MTPTSKLSLFLVKEKCLEQQVVRQMVLENSHVCTNYVKIEHFTNRCYHISVFSSTNYISALFARKADPDLSKA